ncbi:MAG: hypothetical protein HY816_18235 [Candidatus Wallbacteria bacterium]|nr:hypothetical protein [Candidatus Wallbacteria bacterium]
MVQAEAGYVVGMLLGMRHALEPDHLAAVSTLVSQERGAGRGALLGVCWGLGHSVALAGVGLTLAFAGRQMPPVMADVFELGVSVMLIALGVRALKLALRQGGEGPAAVHEHGDLRHEHPGQHPHVHLGSRVFALRSLAVGIVHGLAGSGALTALVLAKLPTAASQAAYMLLFGLGSICGMTLLSGLAGWPLASLGRHPLAARAVSACAGALSALLGLAWGVAPAGRLLS